MIFSKWQRTALSLMLVGLSTPALINAASSQPVTKSTFYPFVASLSGGISWVKAGEQQNIELTPSIENTYTADKPTRRVANGELFLGLQHGLFDKVQGQLGVVLATADSTNLSGAVWDDASAQFNNHVYSYKINHRYVGAQGKLIYDAGFIMPWISGSIGEGFNRSYNFINKSVIDQALPLPNFTDNTKQSFAWTIGFGVEKKLTEHWQAGVGYELANWGKAQLSPLAGQTLNSGPAVNHIYANGVLVNITFVA